MKSAAEDGSCPSETVQHQLSLASVDFPADVDHAAINVQFASPTHNHYSSTTSISVPTFHLFQQKHATIYNEMTQYIFGHHSAGIGQYTNISSLELK